MDELGKGFSLIYVAWANSGLAGRYPWPLFEREPPLHATTGTVLLLKWNILTWPYSYQYQKVKGCEVLGIGIPKDLLNSGSNKGHARIILKPLGKEQPTDFIRIRKRLLATLVWGYHPPQLHLATITWLKKLFKPT